MNSGNNGAFNAAWSNATYNVDVAAYTGSRPLNLTLADYAGHSPIFTNSFNPTKDAK